MAFSGWPEEALDFYDGLAADNTKTYWTKHKAVYTDQVLAPMTELTEELAAEFCEPKIFRPYRDVRFSKDGVTVNGSNRVSTIQILSASGQLLFNNSHFTGFTDVNTKALSARAFLVWSWRNSRTTVPPNGST